MKLSSHKFQKSWKYLCAKYMAYTVFKYHAYSDDIRLISMTQGMAGVPNLATNDLCKMHSRQQQQKSIWIEAFIAKAKHSTFLTLGIWSIDKNLHQRPRARLRPARARPARGRWAGLIWGRPPLPTGQRRLGPAAAPPSARQHAHGPPALPYRPDEQTRNGSQVRVMTEYYISFYHHFK